jgi:hypothetical protein
MLRSVEGLVDEVVLGIDSRSEDRTADIARRFSAQWFRFAWCDDFSYARNLTLDVARRATGFCTSTPTSGSRRGCRGRPRDPRRSLS